MPRKPRVHGGRVTLSSLATHASILTPMRSTVGRPPASPPMGSSPTDSNELKSRRFGVQLSPVYCRRMSTRPVSCYALFEGVAASKPTSWLSMQLYLLNHLAYIRDLNWRSGLFPSWPRILSLVASLPDSNFTGIRSLTLFGTAFRRPHKTSALPPVR